VAARGCVVGEAGVGDVAVKVLAHLVFTGDPPDCFTSTATFLSTEGVVIPQPQSCSHRYSSMKHSELDELLRTGTCPSSPDRATCVPKTLSGLIQNCRLVVATHEGGYIRASHPGTIRMAAFNTAQSLARAIATDTGYARADDEAHALIRTALAGSGDIIPDHDQGTLHVRLDPLPAPGTRRSAISVSRTTTGRLTAHRKWKFPSSPVTSGFP